MQKSYYVCDGSDETIQPIIDELKQLKGKKIDVVLKELTRSDKQNRLFHDNISILAEHSGYDIETMKDIIKCLITDDSILHMCDITELPSWRVIISYVSTATLKKSEMSKLMDYVYMHWERLGLKMIYPEEQQLEAPKSDDIVEMAESIFGDSEESV